MILGFTDPEYVPADEPEKVIGALLTAGAELAEVVREIGEDRRAPAPRRTSPPRWSRPKSTGSSSRPAELASFFILLVVAGNETTRNAIAHGLHLLTRIPTAGPTGRRTSTPWRPPPSRRSCAGRPR